MTNLLVIAIAATIWFFLGVIASAYVRTAAAVATDTFHGYNEVFHCLVLPAVKVAAAAAVAAIRKKTQSVSYTIVDTLTYELPDTSIYSLTVAADSSEYVAGMYLIRDNGKWSNVYLTRHARALMGESADVVALSPARVTDAAGTSHVWHVAIPEFGLVSFAPIA